MRIVGAHAHKYFTVALSVLVSFLADRDHLICSLIVQNSFGNLGFITNSLSCSGRYQGFVSELFNLAFRGFGHLPCPGVRTPLLCCHHDHVSCNHDPINGSSLFSTIFPFPKADSLAPCVPRNVFMHSHGASTFLYTKMISHCITIRTHRCAHAHRRSAQTSTWGILFCRRCF